MIKLSICIPTYNRACLLKECLRYVLPQTERRKNEVKVIVIDNASPDNTQMIVEEYLNRYSCLKYYRNESNLGYAGNQVKCIEYAMGDYMALLCDDDVYLDGQVDKILKVISEREYAFVALNYYGFLKKTEKICKSNFAPEKDIIFKRAYDILNYPSVGHYSGLILNLKLAKNTLQQILAKRSYQCYEKGRGIIGEVAIRSISTTSLPAYFIGQRGLACRIPQIVDYDNLYHLCIDYYETFLTYYKEGIINEGDLDYRAKVVIDRLPRAIISNGSKLNNSEIEQITNKLSQWFKGNKKFNNICLPLLNSLKYKTIRYMYKVMVKIYSHVKQIRYCFKV